MEDHGTNIHEDNSSSEGEVSPYFQKPRPAVQMAKGKERSEEDVEIQSIQQQDSSDKRCFNCAKYQRKCVGTYPFTEKCDPCRSTERRCYPQEKGPWRAQPAEGRCYYCRQSQRNCDGTYPFAQACSPCKAYRRICTAEKPEKGLPKDQKCQCCATYRTKCCGEPPFKDECAACKDRNLKCYAQGIEVPIPVPAIEKCVACRDYNSRRSCDGEKPCTQCVKRNQACSYEDGDVKWTYQPEPEKWKEPTSPTCNECLKWNQSHIGKNLPCDGESPCNCCLEELNMTIHSTNCTYHYENGVSKFTKLHGEYAQTQRKKDKSRRDRRRDERQERIKREESDSDSVSSDIVDDGGNGSDAGGESGNKQPNQDYDHNHDHRSDNFDDEKSKLYDN